jgi:hypothetical protein
MDTPEETGAGVTTPAIAASAANDPVVTEPLRAARTVVLDASRRLLPGEIHYLDHPLFGAVLTVRPWDPAAGAQQEPDAMPALPPEGAEETPAPT